MVPRLAVSPTVLLSALFCLSPCSGPAHRPEDRSEDPWPEAGGCSHSVWIVRLWDCC